jgi:DNA polymerase elongation subunit (family B)
MEVEGWLLDVYPGRDGEMVAWLKKDDGSAVRLTDSWRNAIYVSSSAEGLEQLAEWVEHQYTVFSCEYVNRRVNVFEYAKRPVLKLTLRNADHSERLAKELEMLDVKSPLHIFNADLMPAQTYFFEKELFPLARVRAEQAGASIRWKPLDSVMSEDYRIPPLRKASIRVRVDASGRIPKFSDPIGMITVTSGETVTEIAEGDERAKILSLVDVVRGLDPDIVFVEQGDGFTTHYLAERAWMNGISDRLVLSRDREPLRRLASRGTSYMAYGKVLHTPTSHKLYGRINLDAENYFVFSECGLDGLFEIARLCRMPLHKGSRASIGKCLSSLQAYVAFKDELLIPWKPSRAEIPKTAKTLLAGDRGGFIYEPKVGLHEGVGEIDFTCLTGDTIINTREGEKELAAVTERDEVFTPFGWQKIAKVSKYQIRDKVVKLTLEDGKTLTSTFGHKFPILVRGVFEERTVAKIHRRNALVTTDLIPTPQEDEVAALFGAYAAEGTLVRKGYACYDKARKRKRIVHQHRISFCIGKDEADFAKFIIKTLQKMYPSIFVRSKEDKRADAITLEIYRKGAVNDFISRYRNFIASSNLSSIEKSSFLRGFFEGDGGVNIARNTVQCNQSIINSKKLDPVLAFLRELDINFSNNTYHFDGSLSPNPANYIELASLDSVIKYYSHVGFISGNKQEKLRRAIRNRIKNAKNANHPRFGLYVYSKKRNHLSFIHTKKVVKKEVQDYEGMVFDITLEWSEFPFYFANGILTHNSLFPFIMTEHNISAETVLCWCCPDSGTRVPDVGYHICEKRDGVIPRSLEPILTKRVDYKLKKKNEKDPELKRIYASRVDALKGLLVCSFGFLSYRNAKFGLIDCHISVCAYARQILLETARIAETRGFEVVHGIVDSLWVKKPGATEKDFEELRREIQAAIGLPLAFEGVYRWVAFLPSRMHEEVPVLNRYFGVFEDGSMKVRGIELRRRDGIKAVTDCQSELLRLLAQGKTLDEARRFIPEAIQAVRGCADRIRGGGVPVADLAILNSLSKDHDQYNSSLVQVSAIRQLAEEGLELMAGQSVSYVITDYRSKVQSERVRPIELLDSSTKYDPDRYVELLLRGASAILQPFGVDEEALRDAVAAQAGSQTRLVPATSGYGTAEEGARSASPLARSEARHGR